MKTYHVKAAEVQRNWHIVDAEGLVLGRLASRIATILRGKHKPTFSPHLDNGDFVIVINADKVRLTGSKEGQKYYFRHTEYPGGDRYTTVSEMRRKHPERIIMHAVKGMLPRGPLGRRQLTKLKVYAGAEHPHQAQQPATMTL
ncbi:MAG: 50S ribosomal protein L13 [Candidatus Zixiibacteriota bacterium]|nr:MAG: 50S ribosomal protein L13 [candidate division Zixibacteria bacterium]